MKLTRKQQQLFNEFIDFEKQNQSERFPFNLMLTNIIAWMVSRNLTECKDVEDIRYIYDSMQIDYNECILDNNNIDEYSTETVEKLTGHKYNTVKRQLAEGSIYLINYYFIYKDCLSNRDTSVKLNSNYNIF